MDSINNSSIKTKNNFKEINKKNFKSTNNKMYQIASCSKFITCLIVGKLYELGKLDYDTDINKYLKKWKCPSKNITLRLLITHKSGLIGGGFKGYHISTNNIPSNIEILNSYSSSNKVEFIEKPNTKWIYSGLGYQIIQQVLEEITGQYLYKLMEKYLFKPLKLNNSTGKILYPNKHNYNLAKIKNWDYKLFPQTAAAGVWMSTNDLYKIVIDLSNGYKSNKSKILKKQTLIMFCNERLGNFRFNKKNNDEIQFGHTGKNYGYRINMWCFPVIGECNIIFCNYNTNVKNITIRVDKKLKNSLKRKKTIKNKTKIIQNSNRSYRKI